MYKRQRLADADDLLAYCAAERPGVLLGITSNTPMRHMESVLPMLGLHDHFSWFTCSQDVGVEKPGAAMFEAAVEQARFWVGPDLRPEEVLHVGDSLACDFCGARAAGLQALLLDRSDNPKVTQFQDWLEAPDYPGKSEEDVRRHTVRDLTAVRDLLAGERRVEQARE